MTPPAATRPAPIPPQTEEQFLQTVLGIARLFRWSAYHTRDSRRSTAGFPDLILLQHGRVIAAELKSERGKTTPYQDAWLKGLGSVPGITAVVWRPSQRQQIVEILSGRATA